MGDTIKKSTKKCLNYIRDNMAKTPGTETEVLRAFIEEIGSEVDGWEMRLQELKDQE